MQINQRLFALLKERNITQAQFSDGTGINATTINNWLKRGTDPSADKLSAICKFLGISLEWLVTGEETPCSHVIHGDVKSSSFVQSTNHGNITFGSETSRKLSDEETELIRVYSSLPVKKRINLLNFAFELENEKD